VTVYACEACKSVYSCGELAEALKAAKALPDLKDRKELTELVELVTTQLTTAGWDFFHVDRLCHITANNPEIRKLTTQMIFELEIEGTKI